jgi:hypothetical protein
LLWQLLQQQQQVLYHVRLRQRKATADTSAIRGAPVGINMPGVPLAIRALQAQGFMKGRWRRPRPAWGGAGAIHLKAVSKQREEEE